MSIIQKLRDLELNPVLVKEVRQSVRSMQLLGVLVLLLLGLLASSLLFLGYQTIDLRDNSTLGQGFFIMVMIILMVATAFTASAMFYRHYREREPSHYDLLYITTLTPGRIARGRYMAGVAMTSLVLSLGLPFLTLSYLLRGIEMSSIAAGVGLLAGLSLVLNMWALLVAAYEGSPQFKTVAFVGATLVVCFACIAFTAEELIRNMFTWMAAAIFIAVGLSVLWGHVRRGRIPFESSRLEPRAPFAGDLLCDDRRMAGDMHGHMRLPASSCGRGRGSAFLHAGCCLHGPDLRRGFESDVE